MRKIFYIHLIFWNSLILWATFLLLNILIIQPENYHLNIRDRGRIIQGMLYCLVALVCFMMLLLLIRLNKQRHKDVIIQLIGYFGLSAIGVLLQGIFGIIEFQVRDFQTFFTDSSLVFLVGAGFCLGFFVIDVFRKGIDAGNNKKLLNIFLFVSFLSQLGLFLMKIFEITIYIIVVPIICYLILFLTYFVILLYGSFDLRKRMDTQIEKRAFLLIGMHGILIVCVAFFAILYSIIDIFEFRYMSAILTAFAYISLYKGITLPMKKEQASVLLQPKNKLVSP